GGGGHRHPVGAPHRDTGPGDPLGEHLQRARRVPGEEPAAASAVDEAREVPDLQRSGGEHRHDRRPRVRAVDIHLHALERLRAGEGRVREQAHDHRAVGARGLDVGREERSGRGQ
ncbi:MAG: hypothetical protein ACK55I_01655, partial [bacterium]